METSSAPAWFGLILRELAKPAAALVISHGWSNGASSEQIVGAIVLIGSIFWTWWNKSGHMLAVKVYRDRLERNGLRTDVPANGQPGDLTALAFAAGLSLIAFDGRAADLPGKAPPALALPASAPCTVIACTGFYVGGSLSGLGSNVDVIGQGFANSVFAGGGIFDLHAGYQYWNGGVFFAFEAAIGFESQGGANTNKRRIVGLEEIKIGAALSGLLGGAATAPTTPSQSPVPVAVPASFMQSLLSPYVVIGQLQRGGSSQWVSGAGAEFVLSSGVNVMVEYLYGVPTSDDKAAQIFRLGMNRKF